MKRRDFLKMAGGLAALSLVGCGEGAKNAGLKVGTSGTYYPFSFREDGVVKGFEIDVWKAIAAEMGQTVDFAVAPFSALFGLIEAGKAITAANQISVSEERKKKYLFSETYSFDGAQIVVKSGRSDIKTLADLSGKTVGVNLGSNFEKILREAPNAAEITIKTYDTGIEQDVAIGRTDAFVMDRLSVISLIKKSKLPLEMAGKPFAVIESAYPFLPQNKVLRDQVNMALSNLRKKGELKRISMSWFNIDITERPA